MAAVTELEIFTAIKAKIAAVANGWLAGKRVDFGRRPPNGTNPPYVVIAVEEQDDEDIESDGDVAQTFIAELAAKSVGPDDAEDASLAVAQLDPTWTDASDGGVTLADTDHGVVAVIPKSGRLRLIEPLRDGGQDQYTATRRWEISTAALVGA